jgi:hypothetical protein
MKTSKKKLAYIVYGRDYDDQRYVEAVFSDRDTAYKYAQNTESSTYAPSKKLKPKPVECFIIDEWLANGQAR